MEWKTSALLLFHAQKCTPYGWKREGNPFSKATTPFPNWFDLLCWHAVPYTSSLTIMSHVSMIIGASVCFYYNKYTLSVDVHWIQKVITWPLLTVGASGPHTSKKWTFFLMLWTTRNVPIFNKKYHWTRDDESFKLSLWPFLLHFKEKKLSDFKEVWPGSGNGIISK